MLCAATGRERVSAVQCTFTIESARPVNDPITFPSININQVILPKMIIPIYCICQPTSKWDVRHLP